MVFATPFPFTFLTLDVVSPTQGIKRKLIGWWNETFLGIPLKVNSS